jgi:hypothetical protein
MGCYWDLVRELYVMAFIAMTTLLVGCCRVLLQVKRGRLCWGVLRLRQLLGGICS